MADIAQEDWIQQAEDTDNSFDWWMLIDVWLTGSIAIIFMLRKLNILDSSSPSPIVSDTDVPQSPLAIQASRNFLGMMHRLLARLPALGVSGAWFHSAITTFAVLTGAFMLIKVVGLWRTPE